MPRLAEGSLRWILLGCLPLVAVPFWDSLISLSLVVLPFLVAAFFRDPDRDVPDEGVVSPADGRVSVVRQEEGRLRVGVFMNLHNVHVNRAPLDGRVVSQTHIDGSHLPAFSKSSERNERVVTRFETPDGELETVQIAGTVARRVTSYVEEGDSIERGECIGMIAFSSRVDVVFPGAYSREDLEVEKGDRVRAGESILALR
ncbi:MAG: phosphatidylserine decarboxylase [Halobacteria archaeon]|nr:phosphatidylserine decarboxylase [Halobacteria archaeon]